MNLNILVVDDEELIRYSISLLLRREGHNVFEASNGSEALKLQRKHNFDIIITDIEMPVMRGPELMKKVLEKWKDTFIIIITAFATIDTAVEALRNGAFDYILKPLDFDELFRSVNKIIKIKSLSSENTFHRNELLKKETFNKK